MSKTFVCRFPKLAKCVVTWFSFGTIQLPGEFYILAGKRSHTQSPRHHPVPGAGNTTIHITRSNCPDINPVAYTMSPNLVYSGGIRRFNVGVCRTKKKADES